MIRELIAVAVIFAMLLGGIIALGMAPPQTGDTAPPRPRRRRRPDENPATATATAVEEQTTVERMRLIREADAAAIQTAAELFLRRQPPGAAVIQLRDHLHRRAADAGRGDDAA